MNWKDKAIEELSISEGYATTIKQKLNVKWCGELATALANGGTAQLASYGKGALDILERELKIVSNGEYPAAAAPAAAPATSIVPPARTVENNADGSVAVTNSLSLAPFAEPVKPPKPPAVEQQGPLTTTLGDNALGQKVPVSTPGRTPEVQRDLLSPAPAVPPKVVSGKDLKPGDEFGFDTANSTVAINSNENVVLAKSEIHLPGKPDGDAKKLIEDGRISIMPPIASGNVYTFQSGSDVLSLVAIEKAELEKLQAAWRVRAVEAAASPQSPDQIDPKELARLRGVDETARGILAQQIKVKKLHDEWKRKADISLAAKKTYDEQNALLVERIGEFDDPQLRLPGMSTKDIPPEADKPLEPADKPITDTAATSSVARAEGWQDESITVLMGDGIGRGTLGKLNTAGIATMGELHKALAGEMQIEGIGKAAIEKIRDKALEWLKSNEPVVKRSKKEKKPEEGAVEIVLLKDLLDGNGNPIVEAGAHLPIASFPGGGVGCMVNGVAHRLNPDQWDGIRRAKVVQLTVEVRCGDETILPGAEMDVIRWDHDLPVVKSPGDGREVTLATGHFEALE